MSNSKKILSFQTPKKRAMTPLRTNNKRKTTEQQFNDNQTIESNSINKAEHQFNNIENELIKSYRDENAFLRNLKSDSFLYNKLLGININQEKNFINFSIQRNSTNGRKKLDFSLEENENSYIFTLKDSENCSIPEYFYDVIEFEKKAFPQFFYKAMQAVYETRTN